MSNVKITQLPLATTPLTGTEVFPLVQGTTTKQVSITGLFTSPVMTNPTLGTVGQADLINATGLPISTGVAGLGTGIATFLGTPTSANLRAAVTDETGTGSLVFANSPTLVTPDLGTPSAMVATNITGTALGLVAGSAITNANLTGAVTSVGNATSLGSFTSAQLRTALTDETGSGVAVFATSPTLVTPDLGTPSAAVLTNATGLPLTTGVTGTLGLGNGGTGQTTANAAFNALAPSQTGNSGKYLTTDGTNTSWATNAGGDVVGPSSATDNALARFDTTTGKLIQNSVGILSDAGALSGLTDISASGSVTLSGGTANGVTYLNGSKVLTSGSALTFDGTRLGIGSSAAASTTLDVYGESQHTYLVIRNGAQTNPGYTSPTLYSPASGQLGFGLAASEQMRLTSTGLGIGTSSPLTKLNTYQTGGGALATFGTNTSLAYIIVGGQSTTAYHTRFGYDVTNEYGYIQSIAAAGVYDDIAINPLGGNVGIGTSSPAYKLDVNISSGSVRIRSNTGTANSAGYLLGNSYRSWSILSESGAGNFIISDETTAGTPTRLTLDSAGNLGLGVTPSAWGGGYKAQQWGATSSLRFASGNTAIGDNYYFNGSSNLYLTTNYATNYVQSSGAHNWYTAASGTAGNAITFTQAMTLDASGRLLVGNTTQVSNNSNANFWGPNRVTDSWGQLAVVTTDAYGADIGGQIALGGAAGSSVYGNFGSIAGRKENATNNNYAGYLAFTTTTSAGTGTERARIDSSGNLGLGVTPSAWGTSQRGFDIGYSGALKSSTGSGSVVSLTNNAYYTTQWLYKVNSQAAALYDLRDTGEHRWYNAPSSGVSGAGTAISFTQAMTLDASGNLLVGTTSSSYSASGRGVVEINGSSTALLGLKVGGTVKAYFYTDGTNVSVANQAVGYLGFNTSDTERARIDSGGNMLIGLTTPVAATPRLSIKTTGNPVISSQRAETTGTLTVHAFYDGSADFCGQISIDAAANTTAYATSSDYRLKENIAPMTGALDKVATLKPCTYTWKSDGSSSEGFIAHELAEVCPQAVVGEKDAVDEEGNPVYQGIDTSFLVATLTAALQELNAKFDAYVASHP